MRGDRLSVPTFYRDAVVTALIVMVVIAPGFYQVGPTLLRYPGYLLSFPLLGAYVLLGGETESPFGPSTIHLFVYGATIGVVVAIVARWVRQRYDVSAIGTVRFAAASLLAILGTVAVLVGLLSFVFPFPLPTWQAVLLLLGGSVATGGGLALATRIE